MEPVSSCSAGDQFSKFFVPDFALTLILPMDGTARNFSTTGSLQDTKLYYIVVFGSALTYHLTDRIETERHFVNFVQLAKEEDERTEGEICVYLGSKLQKKRKDREKSMRGKA